MRGGEGGSRGKGGKYRYACVRTCVCVCMTDSHCWHTPTQHYKAIFHQLNIFLITVLKKEFAFINIPGMLVLKALVRNYNKLLLTHQKSEK